MQNGLECKVTGVMKHSVRSVHEWHGSTRSQREMKLRQ